ncbi:UNVERIFIED_CONTAM: Mitochondrial adenine nucleotide transporter ADNT1 [Sesamum radiatum]|uniref:Mitochondrial adenine nucleotide transporter ADNT1 n=1 Tax=Sesamum radiatum TaxID=300843 RepID=A0AAW2JSV8_SESRA
MGSEDAVGKTGETEAVSTIVNLAEEAKDYREGVRAPRRTFRSICKSLFAGGVAGGVSRTAVAPLERLKILLQVQNPHNIKYNGTVQGLKYIWRTEGLRGLFKGNGTNCARIVPNSAVKFFSYEEASKGILWLYRQQTGNGRALSLFASSASHLEFVESGVHSATDCLWLCPCMPVAFKFFSGISHFCACAVLFTQLNGTSCKMALVQNGMDTFWEDAQLTPLLRLGAGACAGIIAMSATYPMDMVRGRLTVQTDKSPTQYRGIFHALRTVFTEEGPRALYKGWLPSVIGVVPYVGLNFAVYESLKDWLIKTNPYGLVENSDLNVTTKLACGAAAGTVGQTVAYPLDVIRRRMQMVGWRHASSVVTGDGKSKSSLEYTGMVDAFRKTVRHEGFGALYKGLIPNSVKVVPSIAIAFVTYEVVKDILGVEMKIAD